MATFRPSGVSVFIRQDLVAGASRTDTTLNIDPIITKDGHRVAMSDIGDIGYAKIDAGKSTEEIISFTGITDNTTTMQLTGVTWGYDFYRNTGDVAANKKKHVSGATLIITNDDHFLNSQYVSIDSDLTIAGAKTFSTTPKSTGGDPLVATDLVVKSYVDALVLGTLTTINVIVPGKAGENVAAGNLVYFDTTDNEWKLTDANTAATVENVLLGIAQGAGTNGNAITDGVLLQGVDENQSGLTEGDVYYASDTAGAIANSAGTVEVTVGLGKSATELYFAPKFNQGITEDQQDALAGTSGTPSGTNKYVTNDDTATSGAGKILRLDGSGYLPALNGSALTSVPNTTGLITKSFIAGENLTAGNAVIASYQTPSTLEANETTASNGTIGVGTNAWIAQTFLTSADAAAITSIKFTNASNATAGLTRASIRATSGGNPTGSDLGSGTVDATGNTEYEVIFSTPILVSPNTTYALVLRRVSGSVDIGTISTNPYANGKMHHSADSGSTWDSTTYAAYDIKFKIYEISTAETQLYKADASSADIYANNFIGFAAETKNAGEATKVNLLVDNNQTGLAIGSTYYLSDTSGAISTAAGSTSRKVGIALSATEILIKQDNV